MSPNEQQRWARLRQLLVDLKPADQIQPTPVLMEEPEFASAETLPTADLPVPLPSLVEPPIEAEIALNSEPQAQAELAQPQEIEAKASPALEETVFEQEALEKPQEFESLNENSLVELAEALVAETETVQARRILDWNCSTRAFFESLPYEGERDYQREIPSQNWLAVPTSHFLEHLVPWYGLKNRHPDANLRQLVDLATQDAMKRASQLQRLQTEEVTASAGHFFRNLNWQGVHKP